MNRLALALALVLGLAAPGLAAPELYNKDTGSAVIFSQGAGVGPLTALPCTNACGANGNLLGSPPTNVSVRGATFYCPPGGSVSFTVALTSVAPPTLVVTYSNPSPGGSGASWVSFTEDLAWNWSTNALYQNIFITAANDTYKCVFRYL